MNDLPEERSTLSRAGLLGRSGALAAGFALPGLGVGVQRTTTRAAAPDGVTVAPRYRPLDSFQPEIDLRGKLALISGASRGNGRAVGESLAARGVDVIGTSRDPATVPDPPAFPLLKLDVSDPDSVRGFRRRLTDHRLFRRHGRIDILCNNAGRMVVGRLIPSRGDLAFSLRQRDLAVRTLYAGHVMITDVFLPLLAPSGYARIVFTVSVASYYSGSVQPGGSFTEAYNAAKAALRTYADNLGGALHEAGSHIRVSTVNPYAMHTALAEHPHPIYLQPVNGNGLSDTDPVFNAVMTGGRQLLANAQPPSRVGETYAQLCELSEPDPDVVVASPTEPLATQGANILVESELVAENDRSAVPLTSV
ncbi:MAG TPA: SDR family NAD(P)-dependent oxidoreductase [Jatrophihabitantaceae bacterium]